MSRLSSSSLNVMQFKSRLIAKRVDKQAVLLPQNIFLHSIFLFQRN